MTVRSVMPKGTSMSPVRRTLPTRLKVLVPFEDAVPKPAYQLGPLDTIAGRVARVSTLSMIVGLPQRPDDGREGRARARHAATALDAGDQGRLLAADERAGAFLDRDVEREVAAEDVLAEQAELAHGRERGAQTPDGQRVLGPDVDVAVGGADGVGGDQHPLEDGVRIALDERAVHEGAGIALVGVADEVALVALRLPADGPFLPGREARAAASAQAGAA